MSASEIRADGSSPVRALAPARAGWRGRSRQHWQLLLLGLVLGDTLALGGALALAYVIRFKTGVPFLLTPPHSVRVYSGVAGWAIGIWLLAFALYRLYDRRFLFNGFHEYVQVLNACTAGMMAVIVVGFFDLSLSISRGWLLLVWLLAVLGVASERFLARRALRWLRRHGLLTARTIIVGTNAEAQALAEQFLANPTAGPIVVGFVDNAVPAGTVLLEGCPVLGRTADLDRVVREYDATELVVATTALSREELLDLYRRLGQVDGVEIRLSSGLFEILTTGVRVQEVCSVPLMTPQRFRITGVDAVLKAALDYTGAAVALLLLSPALLLIALLVKWDSPGPVFHHRRVLGRSGKPFDALKFRTMVVDADAVLAGDPALRAAFEQGHKLKQDPRVTRVGAWLRRTSLDEVPQLLNVLRGEMSLVGPRMVTAAEAARYGKWQLNLLTVKPGLTGPWQVHGRSDLPYEERVRLSTQYIRNYNIWLDLEILLRTIPAVLQSRGAY